MSAKSRAADADIFPGTRKKIVRRQASFGARAISITRRELREQAPPASEAEFSPVYTVQNRFPGFSSVPIQSLALKTKTVDKA